MTKITNELLEEWRDIKEYEGLYQVSNFGRIKSLKRRTNNQFNKEDLIRKSQINKYGYPVILLFKDGKGKLCTIHRLVAIEFIKNTHSKATVNHIDGNKKNNYVANLEWATVKENTIHAYRNLKTKASNSVLDKQKVFNILDLRNVKTYNEIAKMFDVPFFTVKSIMCGRNYKRYVEEYSCR